MATATATKTATTKTTMPKITRLRDHLKSLGVVHKPFKFVGSRHWMASGEIRTFHPPKSTAFFHCARLHWQPVKVVIRRKRGRNIVTVHRGSDIISAVELN